MYLPLPVDRKRTDPGALGTNEADEEASFARRPTARVVYLKSLTPASENHKAPSKDVASHLSSALISHQDGMR